MQNRYVAAAVVAALSGVAPMANAANYPNAATAAGAAHKIYVAGSSAAAAGFINYVEYQICGLASNANAVFSVFTTPTNAVGLPDFRAVSCTAAASSPVFEGDTVTVWYRPEGGSVVGVLPLYNNVSVNQLDLSNGSVGCTTTSTSANTATYTCTGVNGVAPGNGTNDSFSGAVVKQPVQIGVSDLEPYVFGNKTLGSVHQYAGDGRQDPIVTGAYSTSYTGPDVSISNLQANLSPTIAFQQVFGFVASSNLGITDLPKEALAAIFDGKVHDWSKVTTSANKAVSSTSQEIIVCNREVGSGTRAETDIFLNGTGCNYDGGITALVEQAGSVPSGFSAAEPNDNFQTIAELDCVNSHSGAIGYVSIDNFSKVGGAASSFPSAVALTVSGVAATTLNAAAGVYSDVFEAAVIENPAIAGNGADADTFYAAVAPALQDINTTSNSAQIVAIPGADTNPSGATPLKQGTQAPNTSVYISDFTRGGNSCSPLVDTHS